MLHHRRIAIAALAALLLAFARSTGPDWEAQGSGGHHFGASVASAGDVNGDGYEDILVADPDDESGGSKAGKVSVFLGGPDGLAATPARELKGRALDHFGAFLAGIGDMDADGYDDVAIASPGSATVRVYRGKAGSGLEDVPAWESPAYGVNPAFPMPVKGLGDLNGDGCAEFAVGVPWEGHVDVWSFPPPPGGGLPNGVLQPDVMVLGGGWGYGRQLEVGHFDDDDVLDLVVAMGGFDAAGGDVFEVFIHPGATLPDGTVWWEASQVGDGGFGDALAAVDLDGDGRDDLVVGSPWHQDAGGEKTGAIYIYFVPTDGNPMGAIPATILEGLPYELLGTAVTRIGDIDADGMEDFAVGAPSEEVADGRVLIFRGQPGYSGYVTPDFEYLGSAERLGAALASADVNNDGHPDLIMGGPEYNGTGRAIGSYGQETNPLPPAAVTMLRSDGSTISPGGSTMEATLIVQAGVVHPGLASCALEVQVGLVGTPFPPDGPFTPSGSPALTGTTATGTIGLQPGHSYWVRVRSGDSMARVSDWTHVGTASSTEVDVVTPANFPPSVSLLRQLRVADSSVVPTGASFVADKVRFQGTVADGDNDSFTFAVEVRRVSEAFSGVPTGTAGPFAPGQVSIDVAVPEGPVKWQAWAVSSAFGMESPKVRFGSGNQVDFFILAFGSMSKGACSVSGRDEGGLPWWMLAPMLAGFKRRRR